MTRLTITGLEGPVGRLSRADMGFNVRRRLSFPVVGVFFDTNQVHGPIRATVLERVAQAVAGLEEYTGVFVGSAATEVGRIGARDGAFSVTVRAARAPGGSYSRTFRGYDVWQVAMIAARYALTLYASPAEGPARAGWR